MPRNTESENAAAAHASLPVLDHAPKLPDIKSKLATILLIPAALLFSLLLGEIFLNLFHPPPIQAGAYATAKAKVYGWAYPPNASIAAHDPDTGEVISLMKTNSEGWKDYERSRSKPDGTFRILVIGDSYTFGIVSLEKLYTRRLEEILHERGFDKVKVITMGNPGWGADHALVVLEHKGRDYSPDIVIYQNAENDLYPLFHGMRSIPEEDYGKNPWLWPFKFEFNANRELVKHDLSEKFAAATQARETGQDASGTLASLVTRSATAYYIKRAMNTIQANYLVAKGEAPRQVGQFMMPNFGNQKNLEADKNFDLKEENLRDYRKTYKDHVNARLQMVRKIENGEIDQKIVYIVPSEDPFVYRYGAPSAADTYTWRIMEALLQRIKRSAAPAEFVVFTEDGGQGKRDYYMNIGNVAQSGDRYFARRSDQWIPFDWENGVTHLNEIGKRNDIPVVPRRRPYPRYLFDNHTNDAGNENMALDIADFLVEWPKFHESYARATGQSR